MQIWQARSCNSAGTKGKYLCQSGLWPSQQYYLLLSSLNAQQLGVARWMKQSKYVTAITTVIQFKFSSGIEILKFLRNA